jgi:predicted transcriptional regulator
MNREKVIATVSEMPQDFDLEILMERLIFIEKVEKGLQQLNSGNTIPHQEVKQRIKQWPK